MTSSTEMAMTVLCWPTLRVPTVLMIVDKSRQNVGPENIGEIERYHMIVHRFPGRAIYFRNILYQVSLEDRTVSSFLPPVL